LSTTYMSYIINVRWNN